MTEAKRKLVEKLYPYDGDPFKNYTPKPEDIDLHEIFEWGSKHPFFHESIEQTDAKLIVECGTWKGGSAIHMAQKLKEQGKDGCVVCIDTWLGCHLLAQHAPVQKALKRVHGRSEMWKSFYANVFYYGLQDYILPIHMPTHSGFRYLNGKHQMGFDFCEKFDMVYIDASHMSPDVYTDAKESWCLLRNGGHMIFDDVIPDQVTRRYEASDFTEVWEDIKSFTILTQHSLESLEIKDAKARMVKTNEL